MIGRLPVYGPTDPHGDEEHTPDVIVRVDYLMSREQLVTALGIVWAEIAAGRVPESLSVAEVRHEVEAWLSVQGFFELDQQMERDRQRVFPPEQQAVMDALAAAVDRAYPPGPVSEEDAARAFVDRHFPQVAAFLADERHETPRNEDGTVTVDTGDHGPVTIDEPFWCLGDHPAEAYREDISHEGEEYPLIVGTHCHGEVRLAVANLTQRPFSPTDRAVRVAVEFDELHEYDSFALADLADSLVAYAVGPLHQLIERLQLLQDGGES
ncbi:DUF6907 domain-containing protein [Streptomyces sp. NPDC127108]|uniref:DUF6907 domain-containing protein n=1 Tax=Streptomyces sp. NPDC127108 TaxID=3345361 RepID=UPI003638A546